VPARFELTPRAARRLFIGATGVLVVGIVAAGVLVPGFANRRLIDRIATAPDRSADHKYFSMGLRLTLVDAAGTSHFTEGTAEFDAVNDRAHVALPPVVAPQGLDLISQGTILFLSVPTDRQAALDGARWVRVAAVTESAAHGAGVGPVPDPMSVLSLLAGIKGKVHTIGTAKLDGVSVTKYRGAVSIRTMSARVGREGAASVRALRRLGRDSLPVEVWLDGDQLPRYVRVVADQRAEGKVIAQLRVGSFGQPILIGIPPNDAVRPATTFSEALSLVAG
jgi:hypothetical protein